MFCAWQNDRRGLNQEYLSVIQPADGRLCGSLRQINTEQVSAMILLLRLSAIPAASPLDEAFA
jgi:hypothetical protein